CSRILSCSDLSRSYLHLHSFPTRRSSDLEFTLPLPDGAAIGWESPLWSGGTGQAEGDDLLRVGQYEKKVSLSSWTHWKHLEKIRSEEHTSELQSRFDLVCRLLLEKKNTVH